MSADLNAIKARWSAATPYGWPWDADTLYLATGHMPKVQAIAHAPEDIAALIKALEEAVTRIDEIEKWATDHFGDSTEFPTDLAFAFWGMPSAADLTEDPRC
jgi:hypothetical protein